MNIIARHATENGQSIAIIGNPGEYLMIARVSPEGTFLTLAHIRGEAAARKVANEAWLKDMGRAPKMIECNRPAIVVTPCEDTMSDHMRRVIYGG